MAISKELLNLKSAGTYRMIVDKSQFPASPEPLDNTRLLVGFSKKGPINRPLYITDVSQFESIFGGINRNLEARKSYFHRSCLTALGAGPILALNLTKLFPSDTVDAMQFATSCSGDGQTANPQDEDPSYRHSYAGMFNKDAFFVPNDAAMLKTLGADAVLHTNTTNDLLDFTNVGKEPVSILVIKSSDYNTKSYQVTVQDWYGKGEEPEYLNPNSLVSDFMVDVYILRGNWGGEFTSSEPYGRFATDVKFAQYFDSVEGLKRKTVDTDTTDTQMFRFFNENDVKILAQYTGSIIPDFTDKLGRNLYIKTLINADTDATGVLCAVNEAVFGEDTLDGKPYGIDLVGHSLAGAGVTDCNFLSYKGNISGMAHQITECSSAVAGLYDLRDNQFVISPTDADANLWAKLGNYVMGKNHDRLSRIVSIISVMMAGGDEIAGRVVTCQEAIDVTRDSQMDVYTKLTDCFTHYNIYTLNGFTLKEEHMPDGTEARQHEILDLLTEGSKDTNLYNALTDRENIQFRYLVDTFGLGIEPNSKAQYTKLCKGSMSALAIINAPSAADFSTSTNPYFCTDSGSLSAEYITKGGNPDYPNTFLYSLPDNTMGAEFGAFYYPYLTVGTGTVKKNVPPAAYVSNNYIAKYGSEHPWTSIAGERRGVIGGDVVNTETVLIKDTRDWLEPFGLNPIVYHNGVGVVVYGNQTAKQTPESALSKTSVVESVIYIQDNIERILRNYVFETNTAQTRLEIYTLVNNFMKSVKSMGGVYDYTVVMDKSNNTDEVIDHNIGIVDLAIEPVRLMEKLVQRLTILRTGAIEAGGFTVA